jgi:hypothetical protein
MSNVSVNLSRGDLVSLNVRSFLTLRQILPTLIVVSALVVAFIGFTRGLPTTPWNWFALALAASGGAIGALLVGFLLSIGWIFFAASKAPGILGLHEYAFLEDGLVERTQANETLIKWNCAQSVICTDRHLEIEIAPGLIHLLPRRAFADDTHYAAFCEKAKMLARKHA